MSHWEPYDDPQRMNDAWNTGNGAAVAAPFTEDADFVAFRVMLSGQPKPSPSRGSIQLTLVCKHNGGWHCEALMNARKLAMELQYFLDELDSPVQAQRQVSKLVALLKKRHR